MAAPPGRGHCTPAFTYVRFVFRSEVLQRRERGCSGRVAERTERFAGNEEPRNRGRQPSPLAVVDDINVHRARLEKAKADRAELQLEVERGNLVDKRLTEDTAMGLYLMVREGIQDAVERLSSILAARYKLPEPELRRILSDHMYESLERLADEIEARVE